MQSLHRAREPDSALGVPSPGKIVASAPCSSWIHLQQLCTNCLTYGHVSKCSHRRGQPKGERRMFAGIAHPWSRAPAASPERPPGAGISRAPFTCNAKLLKGNCRGINSHRTTTELNLGIQIIMGYCVGSHLRLRLRLKCMVRGQ